MQMRGDRGVAVRAGLTVVAIGEDPPTGWWFLAASPPGGRPSIGLRAGDIINLDLQETWNGVCLLAPVRSGNTLGHRCLTVVAQPADNAFFVALYNCLILVVKLMARLPRLFASLFWRIHCCNYIILVSRLPWLQGRK